MSECRFYVQKLSFAFDNPQPIKSIYLVNVVLSPIFFTRLSIGIFSKISNLKILLQFYYLDVFIIYSYKYDKQLSMNT